MLQNESAMTELVVVSGKGGTGKTSLVGSLAALSHNKVLVDCDVDAADLHLILPHRVQKTTEFTGGKRATISEEKCTQCGLCLVYCRFEAIRHEAQSGHARGDRFWVDPHACDGCGVCVRHCPEEAIDFREVKSGEWYLSETSWGPLVHARLGIAQANSGKLVSVLRQQARRLADERGLDLIMVDGPPGIGCPVIAAIAGSGFVLVVTEPSLSARHDMERLLELTRHFKIRAGICVNRADINPDLTTQIEELANKMDLPVLGRIRHDEAVTAAQLQQKSVVENGSGPAAKDIIMLWDRIRDAIG
jgi:MinD superfamily P-loop ATPase